VGRVGHVGRVGRVRPVGQVGQLDRLRLRDRIAPGVEVLFVGINPGMRSALTGHHFAGYSNRFWRLLFDAGLVPEAITHEDDDRLPEWGYGITNIVPRPTAGMTDLRPGEFRAGAKVLMRKIRRYRPAIVAVVGVTVWRALLEAIGERDARTCRVDFGFQTDLATGSTRYFVLPNASGRNANYSYDEMLAAYKALRAASYGR
jgi:TDG/mug DNA glycosylase family protein